MANTLDITTLTDNALDALLGADDWTLEDEDFVGMPNSVLARITEGAPAVWAEDLARTWRRVNFGQAEPSTGAGPDYEGMILDRQEREAHSELNY